MRTKTIATMWVALLALAGVASAQGVNFRGLQVKPFDAVSVADNVTAVATDVAIYVKYVGTAAGVATVAVATNNSVAFVANGVADPTINVQADTGSWAPCGATPGTLDLTDADCDTMGELINHINRSANWVAVLHGALASDTSNGKLNNLTAADAKQPEGLGLLKLTSATLYVDVVLVPGGNGGRAVGIQSQVNYKGQAGVVGLPVNPFADRDTTLLYASENITTTDNAGNRLKYICVVPTYTRVPVSSTANRALYSEVATTLYDEAAAATTTTGRLDEFLNAGGVTCNKGKGFVRVNGNTTLTAPTVIATGYQTANQ